MERRAISALAKTTFTLAMPLNSPMALAAHIWYYWHDFYSTSYLYNSDLNTGVVAVTLAFTLVLILAAILITS